MRQFSGHYLICLIIILFAASWVPMDGKAVPAIGFDSTLAATQRIEDYARRLAVLQELDKSAAGRRPAQSVRYFEALLDAYTRLSNDSGMMASNSQLAFFYARTNRFDEALSHYFNSLHLAERRADYDQQITCYLRIGFVYKNMAEVSHDPADLDKAMSYSEKAMEVCRRYKINDRMSSVLTNIGIIQDIRKNHQVAIGYFRKAIRAYETSTQRKINPGDMWIDLAIALKNNHEYPSSLEAYNTARRILDTAGNDIARLILRANIANLYYEMGRMQESKTLALQVVSESTEKGYDEVKADSYALLAKLYKKQQDYPGALDYTDRLLLLKDTILNKQRAEQIADMQTRYETKLKDRQIITQEARISFDRKINALLWISIGMLLAIGMIIFFNQRRTRHLYIQISRQSKELERLNGIKDRLFSTISHDMRAPVNSLLSFTMILDGGNIPPEKLALYAAELKNSLGYTATLMENLLNFARSQMQGYHPKAESVSLAAVIRDALVLAQSAADQKGITIANSVPQDVNVIADVNMLALIIRNLLGNAIKFTHDGGSIRLSAVKAPDGFICWEIEDTGKGIEPALVAAFNNSVRADEQPLQHTPGTGNEKGSGLGLMLSKTFLALMGGRITLSSAFGVGSTFSVCLPSAS